MFVFSWLCIDPDSSVHTEPIVMEGSSEFRILRDKWTAVSADEKR